MMNTKVTQLDLFDGGEPLEGSGFEDEEALADSEENLDEENIDLPLSSSFTHSAKISGYVH